MGIAPRHRRRNSHDGIAEVEVEGMPAAVPSPVATAVHIEFENGLKFDRTGMEVDSLISFLTKIRGALCLG